MKIKYKDFTLFTRSKTESQYLENKFSLSALAKQLWQSRPFDKPIRLLGLSLSNLNTEEKKQVSVQLKIPFPEFFYNSITISIFVIIRYSVLLLYIYYSKKTDMNGTMLQSFHWYTDGDSFLWKNIQETADYLKDIGITAVWFPPVYKCASGAYSVGYDPYDLFDLGEFNQKRKCTN